MGQATGGWNNLLCTLTKTAANKTALLPVKVCTALSLEGSGSFLWGRLSVVSCVEKSPGLSVNLFRPLEWGFETLQLPIALVKRFVCSSLLAGSELGVKPPRDKLGELSEQSICKGVCNPKARELASVGSRWTHCSSLLIKLLEGERWGQDIWHRCFSLCLYRSPTESFPKR